MEKDMFKQKASEIFGVPYEEVTKEQRAEAKENMFGEIYGGSAGTITAVVGGGKSLSLKQLVKELGESNCIICEMGDMPREMFQVPVRTLDYSQLEVTIMAQLNRDELNKILKQAKRWVRPLRSKKKRLQKKWRKKHEQTRFV